LSTRKKRKEKRDSMNIGRESEILEFKKSTGEVSEGVISIASIMNKHGSGEQFFREDT